MQLNRYLALCGVASRRKANEVILEKRVEVNGKLIEKLGLAVDPDSDEIRMDGQLLVIPRRFRYVLLNKPIDTITSVEDGFSRKTVLDIIRPKERIFPVGRLDSDTEGVLLLTNDGDLAYRLTHPKFEMQKIYHATVSGQISGQAIAQLEQGVEIEPGVNVSGEVRVLSQKSKSSVLEIRIHEGKKRQIKRMLKEVGHPVLKLIRTNFAGLTAKGLATGAWRELSDQEVERLYWLVGLVRNKK